LPDELNGTPSVLLEPADAGRGLRRVDLFPVFFGLHASPRLRYQRNGAAQNVLNSTSLGAKV